MNSPLESSQTNRVLSWAGSPLQRLDRSKVLSLVQGFGWKFFHGEEAVQTNQRKLGNTFLVGGGFKDFLFSLLPGEMTHFDEHIFQLD